MIETVKKLKSSEYLNESGKPDNGGRIRVNNDMPRIFRKAGVSQRDSFQAMCQKVTENGKELITFAMGVLTATKMEVVATTAGFKKVLRYKGIEITAKEKIWAVEFLANRGFGKAEQVINVNNTSDNKSTDELRLEALKILQKVARVQEAVQQAEAKVVDVSGFPPEACGNDKGQPQISPIAQIENVPALRDNG